MEIRRYDIEYLITQLQNIKAQHGNLEVRNIENLKITTEVFAKDTKKIIDKYLQIG